MLAFEGEGAMKLYPGGYSVYAELREAARQAGAGEEKKNASGAAGGTAATKERGEEAAEGKRRASSPTKSSANWRRWRRKSRAWRIA